MVRRNKIYARRSDSGRSHSYPQDQRTFRSDIGGSHNYPQDQRSYIGGSHNYPQDQRSDIGGSHSYSGNRINRSVNDKLDNVDYDAKNFEESSNMHLRFEICALCGIEDWNMKKLDNYAERIKQSQLQILFDKKIAQITDTVTSAQEKAFIKDLQIHLPNGLLRNANHICNACSKSFSKEHKYHDHCPGKVMHISYMITKFRFFISI